MRRIPICVLAFGAAAFGAPENNFSGAEALNFTAKAVAFGERPSGSVANAKLRAYIHAQLGNCEAAVRALDLIDFNYGPDNAYWHTPQDTMDKLSAHSLEVIGNVLMRVIPALEAEK